MKKILLVFAALVLAVGFVMAEDDEGLGLTVGLEYGIKDLKEDQGDSMYLRPMFAYSNSTLVEDLDLYAEVGVPFWGKPDFWLGIDLDIVAEYSRSISDATTLGFIVESQTIIPAKDPINRSSLGSSYFDISYTDVTSGVIPGIKLTQKLGIGSVFLRVDIPIWYAYSDLDNPIGLDFSAGIDTDIGFGLTIKDLNALKVPDSYDGTSGFAKYLEITPSFTFDPIYVEVYFGIPLFTDGIKSWGVWIEPWVEVSIPAVKGLTAYASVPITNAGSDDDLNVRLKLGAKYSF